MKIFRKLTSMLSGERPVPTDFPETGPTSVPTITEIEALLFPLARNTTVLRLKDASRLHPDSAKRTQFGGNPYFERGMEWPLSENGTPLDFVFQVFASETTELPKDIKLIQFFYSHDEMPVFTDDKGWKVTIFKELNTHEQVVLSKPEVLQELPYCEVVLEPAVSLPDWEGIIKFRPQVQELLMLINTEEPWEIYEQICEKITGSSYYQTQLGGYPRWVQSEATPLNSQGKKAHLLFQVDSEDDAGIMWGDVGLVYVFYDETDDKVWFELQCH